LKEPEGYQENLGKNKSVNNYQKLNNLIYGLVQAIKAWCKRLAIVLYQELNFEQSKIQNCLLERKDNQDIVLLIV
jgi:hypothetical protein